MIRMAQSLSTWIRRQVNSAACARPLERCVLCLVPAHHGGLCRDCLTDLPDNPVACERCALPLTLPRPDRLCRACRERMPPQDFCRTPWRYEFPVDRMIQSYKYHGWRAPGRALALNWARRYSIPPSPAPEALLPAPIAPERLRERGFSQSAEITAWLSRTTGIAMKTGLLERRSGYQPQAGLNRGERRRNLGDAFFVRNEASLPAHVAVVDDVITTGASGEAMALCLREAGVSRVDLWALARTP